MTEIWVGNGSKWIVQVEDWEKGSSLFFNKFTEEEKEYLYEEDLENGMRLGCQLKIRKGEVTITWKGNRAK